MFKYSLGIDISKSEFHCCISSIDKQQKVKIKGTRQFTNNPKGFAEFHQWVTKKHKDTSVQLVAVMEATGSYYEQLALFLSEKGYYLSVILPNKAKNYLKYLGAKSKNDKIDSKGLSRMGAEQNIDKWSPLSKYFYELRAMTRQRQSYQELKTRINNQLGASEYSMYQDKMLINQQKSLLRKIEKYIVKLEERIHDHIESREDINKKVDQICKIKGVGRLTVATVIAETNGFELFENQRQLVSFAGYDVVENQSGKHAGKTRMSKKGNSRIRRCLHMPAFSVVTNKQTPFLALYNRVYETTKIKMKGYVAVQKKILIIIYSLWKKDEAYIENYKQIKHTGEKEQESVSLHGLAQAKTGDGVKKCSTNPKADATQGQHTVEKSQSAASLQLQI